VADARTFQLQKQFPFIYMLGNAFNIFLARADQEASFKDFVRGLRVQKRKHPSGAEFLDACQHRFLVRSRQKMLKGMPSILNKWKLLLELERAGICHHPLNRDTLRLSLLGGQFDHLCYDIHSCDLIALFRHTNGHRSGSTREIKQRPPSLRANCSSVDNPHRSPHLPHHSLRISIPFKIF